MAKIILTVGAEFKEATDGIKKLKKQVNELAVAFNKVKANKDLTSQIKALTEWNKSLAAAVEKVNKVNNQNAIANEKLAQAQAKTSQETSKAKQEAEKLTQQRIKSADATGKLHITEEKLAREQAKTIKSEQQLGNETKKTTDETEKQTEKTKSLVEVLTNFSITSKLLYGGLRTLKTALKDVNETLADTEKRIIAIQRVLPEGSVSDKDLSNRLYDLAIEYGQSFSNVADIATEFARTGISYADTIEATRAALLALNVAELDTTQATEGMIAIMAQFSLSADQMNNVVDKLNKVADRFPVTTQKLMAALQRMGSSASIAGLSLDETIGIATTLSKATGRSGANVGTAANALIQYSTKEKALNTYASLSPEIAAIVEQYKIGAANVLDIWQALSKEINNLTYEQSEKLDVLAEYFESGEGAGLKDELEAELGDIFNDISGVFSTANTFRKNYFVALLQNMGTVEEAAQVARDSQGYSIKENEKEMQTYERRVTALQEHWHKLANDEQGWLSFRKGLVEVGDLLLLFVEYTGGLRTAFIGLGTVVGMVFGQKIYTQISGIITSIRSLTTATEGAATAATSLSTAWQGVFAIVGLAITAISALVGAIEKYNAEQHEANLKAISAWKQSKENIVQLRELYEKYDGLITASGDYKEVEEQIITLLGDKTTALEGLTKGTKEYTEALKKLAEQELLNYIAKTATGARAAENELSNVEQYRAAVGASKANIEVLKTIGLVDSNYDYDKDSASGSGNVYGRAVKKLERSGNGKDTVLKQYFDTMSYVEQIEAEAAKRNAAGDFDGASLLLKSLLYEEMTRYLEENRNTIQDYIDTTTSKYLNEYLIINDLSGIHSEEDYRKALIYIYKSFDKSDANVDLYKDKIEQVLKVYSRIADSGKEIADNSKDTIKGLENISDQYKNIVNYVKELADANSDVTEELRAQQEIAEANLETAKKAAQSDYIKQQLDNYINGLKVENEIADKNKSIEEARAKVEEARLAVEEKRKSVKEAEYALQKAQDELEYARNNRSERVFNAQTGMWEYQANQKNVQSAQEKVRQATEKVEDAVKNVDTSIKAVEAAEQNVQKAVDNLTKYLQDNAVAEIKKAIEENGSLSQEELSAILKNWDLNENSVWAQGLKQALSDGINGAANYAANTSAVQNATKAVNDAKKAIEDYNKNITYNQYVSDLQSLFEKAKSGKADMSDVDGLLNLYRNKGFDSELDKARERIQYEIDKANGVYDANRSRISGRNGAEQSYDEYLEQEQYRLKPFDSGGVLNGVGGIKATSQPEMIIDPELTRRILSPANNEAFERFANSLGIIFGSPMREGLKSTYSNTWSRTSNNDNRNYVINGVPIPKEAAAKYTIVELFENMDLV